MLNNFVYLNLCLFAKLKDRFSSAIVKNVHSLQSIKIINGLPVLMGGYRGEYIGLGPIKQVRHVLNKNSSFQGRLHNVVKVIFHTKRNCS